jgi:hypothetical protein
MGHRPSAFVSHVSRLVTDVSKLDSPEVSRCQSVRTEPAMAGVRRRPWHPDTSDETSFDTSDASHQT